MGEIAGLRALVERANGVGRQRAKAHRGDVEQRNRIGLRAIGTAHHDPEIVVFDLRRGERMGEPLIALGVHILLGAEGSRFQLPLRALVDNRALRPVERRPIEIALQKILADFRTHLFENEAQVGEDRIIAPQGVPGLDHVPDANGDENGEAEGDPKQPDSRQWREGKGGDGADDRQQKGHVTHQFLPGVRDAAPTLPHRRAKAIGKGRRVSVRVAMG